MNKEKRTKKKLVTKIGIGVVSLVGLAVVAVTIYWFSLPLEARNMVSFMMFSSDSYDNYIEYQVVERNEEALQPSGHELVGPASEEGDNNVNINTVSEMVLNEESAMFKVGMVQMAGIEDYTGWHLLADEGAAGGEYPFGPSPLSYYTAGIASNLHTQVLMAAEAYDVVLDDVTVEVINDFRWDNMMADDGTGHLDVSTVNIIIESKVSDEVIEQIKETAINGWATGQALMSETPVTPNLMINGDDWDLYHSNVATSVSDESYDNGILMSSVTDVTQYPKYTELKEEEEVSILAFMDSMNNMSFQIYAIAGNMNNPERPYYQSVTISTPSGESWELYADEFMGENDLPIAPTPLEYFTVGTTLCLTSQTTLVGAMMDLDVDDYRVEHFFEYSQKDVNTVDVTGALDQVETFVFVQGGASQETFEVFLSKSLALCFAGEGLVNVTDMNINMYVNGDLIK